MSVCLDQYTLPDLTTCTPLDSVGHRGGHRAKGLGKVHVLQVGAVLGNGARVGRYGEDATNTKAERKTY